ncbi:unnamed protein product [Dracunculus medinensis]|uniref:MATH domain-containing protein n=1 Tax=Dracunculus medinensis TaxID=318479 RepID=A0A0N4U8S7_DRAME|nr:unnamed protein product [Dracunculus medinensis]
MNARVGKPAIIYSPTFFSHRHGYKMALVFAPYGDGDVSLTITPRITENNLLFLDRPKADRNPAFGLKSFVDLRFMKSKDEFVRDDCCFIRVDVDLSPIYDYI